jgi:hypothetical protein
MSLSDLTLPSTTAPCTKLLMALGLTGVLVPTLGLLLPLLVSFPPNIAMDHIFCCLELRLKRFFKAFQCKVIL